MTPPSEATGGSKDPLGMIPYVPGDFDGGFFEIFDIRYASFLLEVKKLQIRTDTVKLSLSKR